MNNKITIGRIIRVVLKDRSGNLVTRPGIIVRTWGQDPANPENYVNAQVFVDGSNDFRGLDYTANGEVSELPPSTLWKTSLKFKPEADEENTWHWPPRD